MNQKLFLGLKLSVFLLVALLIIPISSSFAQEKPTGKSEKPSFTLIPNAGPAGTVVDVLASGFPSDWKITLPPGATSDSTTTELGSFEFKVTIPANAKDGPYVIPVKVGDVSFKAVFTVRNAWHGPMVSPPSSYVPGKFVNSTKQNSELKGAQGQQTSQKNSPAATLPSTSKYTAPTLPDTAKYSPPKLPSTAKYTAPTLPNTAKYAPPTLPNAAKYAAPTLPHVNKSPSGCLPGMYFDMATKKCLK